MKAISQQVPSLLFCVKSWKNIPLVTSSGNRWVNAQREYVAEKSFDSKEILTHRRVVFTLKWRHNERHGVSIHRRLECLLNRLGHTKESIKAPRHWPLWGQSTGQRWIPLTKGQLHENVSFDDVITTVNVVHVSRMGKKRGAQTIATRTQKH